MRRRPGRPSRAASNSFAEPVAPIRVPLGPALVEYGPKRRRGRPRKPIDYLGEQPVLVEYGPKRRRGRPRKPIDYLAPPKPPKALKEYGPKRKPGRPKKFTTNVELDRAIQAERMPSGASAATKIQNAVRQRQAINRVANLYTYKQIRPSVINKLNASVMANDMLNSLMPRALGSIPKKRPRGRPPGSKNKPK
jgi:hypothetical protein